MDLTLGILTLGVANWIIGLLTVGFLFCSVLLILTVLIQRPQGGGLSGAFGAGAGSGETAFGARTGDALTIATISFFLLWLGVAVGLVWVMTPNSPASHTVDAGSNQGPAMPQGTTGGPDGTPGVTTPAEGQAAPGEGAGGEPPVEGGVTPPSDGPAEQPADDQPPAGAGDAESGDPADTGDGGGG